MSRHHTHLIIYIEGVQVKSLTSNVPSNQNSQWTSPQLDYCQSTVSILVTICKFTLSKVAHKQGTYRRARAKQESSNNTRFLILFLFPWAMQPSPSKTLCHLITKTANYPRLPTAKTTTIFAHHGRRSTHFSTQCLVLDHTLLLHSLQSHQEYSLCDLDP